MKTKTCCNNCSCKTCSLFNKVKAFFLTPLVFSSKKKTEKEVPHHKAFLYSSKESKQMFLKMAIALVLSIELFYLIIGKMNKPFIPPQNITIGNVTEQSVTVSFTTEKMTYSGIIVSNESNSLKRGIYFFLCDKFELTCSMVKDEIPNPSYLHYIKLTGLQPNTPYYYRIKSAGRLFKLDNTNTILPAIKTASILDSLSMSDPLYSRVYSKPTIPLLSSLIQISVVNRENKSQVSSILSTITDNYGMWLVNLGNLRSLDALNPYIFKGDELIKIEVTTGSGLTKTYYKEIVKPNLPDIIVSDVRR